MLRYKTIVDLYLKIGMTKTCSRCKADKSFTEFFRDASSPDGYGGYCKPCRGPRKLPPKGPQIPSHLRKEYQKWYTIRVKYGITRLQYEALFEDQEGRCRLCKVLGSEVKRPGTSDPTFGLCVDHDHNTGLVRGLLCNNCNRAIGLLQDNPELLDKASEYVKTGGVNLIPDAKKK